MPGIVSSVLASWTSHTLQGIGWGCPVLVESLRYRAAYNVDAVDGTLSDESCGDGELVKHNMLVPPPYIAISTVLLPLLLKLCLCDPGPAVYPV